MRKQLTVITGGSSGLGLACASCMAHETTLVLCARGPEKLAEAKKNLEAYGAVVLLSSGCLGQRCRARCGSRNCKAGGYCPRNPYRRCFPGQYRAG